MLRKAVSLLTLSVFIWTILTLDLARAQEEFKKPTFEEIYKNYSFIDTATLAKKVSYNGKELEQELKRLRQKETEEKEIVRQEQIKAKVELKKNQKELNDIAGETRKLEKKYTRTETVIRGGKPYEETRLNREALENDTAYQTLMKMREEIECRTKEWEIKSNEIVYQARRESIKIYYEVLKTQIDLLRDWPEEARKIEAEIKSGQFSERKFGNPENIGLRDLGVGEQSQDLRILQDPELKRYLEEFEKDVYQNQGVRGFVTGLIQTIVKNSDLKIPLEEKNVFLLKSDDVNAFAIGGGILGINRGLLLQTENEAQLAGVLAHEIGHIAARHTHRLMSKAQMRNIIFQAVQIALLFTGIGYWAFYGISNLLGLTISLEMLGVSRDFEVEADILGMQYLWQTGYDPMSFMHFFEKMGRDKGYVRNTSFFRTHPAFSKRISNAYREFNFLPVKDEYVTNSDAFLMMKARLCLDLEKEKKEEQEEKTKQYRPSLTKKKDKQEKDLEKRCGLTRPTDNRPSPCEDPALQPFKDKAREEMDQEQEKREKSGPELKRPPQTPPE